ncbi:MAG: hypothetical protein NVSMB68_09120 [Thermoanaerobaculia bacterium]
MSTTYHVTVEVPRGMDVEVGTHYGDVSIEGSFGDIDVDLRGRRERQDAEERSEAAQRVRTRR